MRHASPMKYARLFHAYPAGTRSYGRVEIDNRFGRDVQSSGMFQWLFINFLKGRSSVDVYLFVAVLIVSLEGATISLFDSTCRLLKSTSAIPFVTN